MQTYNLKEIYIDQDDPWMEIIVVVAFSINYTKHTLKSDTKGQLLFGRDVILRIKHIVHF